MQLIERLLASLERLERAVTFVAFALLVCVVFADVLSRELTGTGLHWARQVGVWANLVVVMVGIGLASSTGTHLRPRFADRWLPARWSDELDRLGDLGMALFSLAFAGLAVGLVREGFVLDERSAVLGIVVWPLQAVIPAVFVIAAFRHGAYAVYPALRPQADNGLEH